MPRFGRNGAKFLFCGERFLLIVELWKLRLHAEVEPLFEDLAHDVVPQHLDGGTVRLSIHALALGKVVSDDAVAAEDRASESLRLFV